MQKPTVQPQSRDGRESKFFWWEGTTLVINIIGKPSARSDSIGRPKGRQLKVSVTAPPKLGRATDHMVQFLAGEFGVSASAITVVYGRMNVNKQLRIEAPTKLPSVIQDVSAL